MIEYDPQTGFPISMTSARAAGLIRYFTGKPCKYGHVAERRASTMWAKRHPDRKRAVENRRRARKYAAGGSYTASDIAELFKHQRGRCAYCPTALTKKNRHIDHIEPIARGGTNDRSNLQLLCQPCNSSKGARDPIVFAQSIGRLL